VAVRQAVALSRAQDRTRRWFQVDP